MFARLVPIQRWKHIAVLGALSTFIAATVLLASLAARTVATTQLPLSPLANSTYRGAEACVECHPDEHQAWIGTKHAQASDPQPFGVEWAAHGRPRSCLRCHTTGYDPATGETALAGISCEGCHGFFEVNHPPTVMSVAGEAHNCGECHWTTYTEWQLSVHAQTGVTCISCHAVHSQAPMISNGRLPCASCHEERYEAFAHATHASVGADCETCHMYKPPATDKTEGRVSTGHTFSIGPEACASCHRDTIHTRHEIPDLMQEVSELRTGLPAGTVERLTRLEEQVDSLQGTAIRNLYVGLVAGSVVGLALGFAAAWTVVWILERGRKREAIDTE